MVPRQVRMNRTTKPTTMGDSRFRDGPSSWVVAWQHWERDSVGYISVAFSMVAATAETGPKPVDCRFRSGNRCGQACAPAPTICRELQRTSSRRAIRKLSSSSSVTTSPHSRPKSRTIDASRMRLTAARGGRSEAGWGPPRQGRTARVTPGTGRLRGGSGVVQQRALDRTGKTAVLRAGFPRVRPGI